ncbi:MAG: HAD family hydrolase [Micrococcales bacterium]|nr:HAD family hydrolase [Micrococcales bacterium]
MDTGGSDPQHRWPSGTGRRSHRRAHRRRARAHRADPRDRDRAPGRHPAGALDAGGAELLAAARSQGIPTAIVSNSWRVLLDLLVVNMDVQPDVTVSSTEIERPKPDPQPYLRACDMLGADPQATWVIEDSPTGAAGGLAAGCLVVGVGASMAGQDDPRLWRVESLSDITVGSLGRDGLQDPQA